MINCPLCNQELACGWWCIKCKSTTAHAQIVKNFEYAMQSDSGALKFFTAVIVFALMLLLLSLLKG